MDQVFVIGYREVALLGGLVTFVVSVVASVVVWAVNGRFNQIELAITELKDRIDRVKAEVMDRIDRVEAGVMDRIDRVEAGATVQVKESEERSAERWRAADARADKREARDEERWRAADARADKREARDEERWRAADARADKREARDEERHREIQSAFREVSYRVGRLEGAGGASAGPAPRSGRHSPRQADEPSGAPDSEMVVVAGVRAAEPALAAGQAHQAVPGPRQATPQGDGTEPEPRTEEPPDTAR